MNDASVINSNSNKSENSHSIRKYGKNSTIDNFSNMKQDTEGGWRANPVMVSREKNAGLADIEKKARLDQVVVDDWGNNDPRSDFVEAARNDSKVANFDFAEAARNDSRVANTSFSTTLHEKLINKQKSNNIAQNENKKVKNYKIKDKYREKIFFSN